MAPELEKPKRWGINFSMFIVHKHAYRTFDTVKLVAEHACINLDTNNRDGRRK